LLFVLVLVAIGLGRWKPTPLRTHHWLLLFVGLTQVPIWAAAIVVGWLLALGWRRSRGPSVTPLAFDIVQVLLVIATVASLAVLFFSISQGLLGAPQMQVQGNGSTAQQ